MVSKVDYEQIQTLQKSSQEFLARLNAAINAIGVEAKQESKSLSELSSLGCGL
jgi:hypothetical protein